MVKAAGAWGYFNCASLFAPVIGPSLAQVFGGEKAEVVEKEGNRRAL